MDNLIDFVFLIGITCKLQYGFNNIYLRLKEMSSEPQTEEEYIKLV